MRGSVDGTKQLTVLAAMKGQRNMLVTMAVGSNLRFIVTKTLLLTITWPLREGMSWKIIGNISEFLLLTSDTSACKAYPTDTSLNMTKKL